MEKSQGNSLYHYLKQCVFILFIYLFIYLFYKNEEQEGKTGPFWGIGTIVARGMWEEGVTG
jgi:hypothetical protein